MSENTPSDDLLSAINAWKIALLDLTGRNQLLFLKDFKYQIDLDKFNDEDGNNFQTEKFINELIDNTENDQFEIAPIDYFIVDPTDDVSDEKEEDADITENQKVESERLENILNILNEYGLDNKIFDAEIIKNAFSKAVETFKESGYPEDIEKWEVEALPKIIEKAKVIIKESAEGTDEVIKKNITDPNDIKDLLNRLRDDDQ